MLNPRKSESLSAMQRCLGAFTGLLTTPQGSTVYHYNTLTVLNLRLVAYKLNL